MDIWTLISLCSAIYLIWYYSKRRKLKKLIKEEERQQKTALLKQEEERLQKEKELEQKRKLLGLAKDAPSNSKISLDKICTWETSESGLQILRFTPPFDCHASVRREQSLYSINGVHDTIAEIVINGFGRCTYTFGLGVANVKTTYCLMKNDIVAEFSPGIDAVKKEQERQEAEKARRQKQQEEREKAEIAKRVKERQRKRDLEKIVTQELIDNGELFGEQPKRPPIPREVVDAVYRRDGGRCVYCGSTENLQLDHIIPFSKGGSTNLENLQLLCQKCNLEKSNHIG